MKKKFYDIILAILISLIICYLLGFILNSFISNHFKFILQARYLTDFRTIVLTLSDLFLRIKYNATFNITATNSDIICAAVNVPQTIRKPPFQSITIIYLFDCFCKFGVFVAKIRQI